MASSTICCHRARPAGWLPDSTCASRPSNGASSIASHWASNCVGSASRNSSAASVVSGVPGSILWRSRSASSLTNAVRGAKPKSASKVVMSTVCASTSHQACRRSCSSGWVSSASRNSCTRLSAASGEAWSPRIQANSQISHRWRCATPACGSSSRSRVLRSRMQQGQCSTRRVGLSPLPASSTNMAMGASKRSPSSATQK